MNSKPLGLCQQLFRCDVLQFHVDELSPFVLPGTLLVRLRRACRLGHELWGHRPQVRCNQAELSQNEAHVSLNRVELGLRGSGEDIFFEAERVVTGILRLKLCWYCLKAVRFNSVQEQAAISVFDKNNFNFFFVFSNFSDEVSHYAI